MGIAAQVGVRLKEAMKAKDKNALAAVRRLKNAIMVAEREGARRSLSEEEAIKLVRREIKQCEEAAEMYDANGKPEAAAVERSQVAVLEDFLPKALDPAAVEALAREAVAASGASSLKQLGQAMRVAREKAGGRVDGKTLVDAVRAVLQG